MTLRLALLVCDTPHQVVRDVYGAYPEIFTTFLKSSFPPSSSTEWNLDCYDVVSKMEYPSIDGLDGIILTGSAASAYENIEWINKLVDWVGQLIRERRSIPIVGICFGHQIVARAFGGQCVPNEGIWEIGPTKIQLSATGKKVFGGQDILTIHQMHRDHVPFLSLPPNDVHLLASNDICQNQGFATFYPGTDKVHILTVQGHPEFVNDLVRRIVDIRAGTGVIDSATFQEYQGRKDDAHDGTGAIGKAIWKVLGVE